MNASTLITAGIVLLTVVAVESGGLFLLKGVRGRQPANALQTSFYRAGHAHAGVLIILGLVTLLLVDGSGASGAVVLAPTLVLSAAILMPAGFFLSVLGKDPQKPNGLAVLLYVGAAALAAGLVLAGVGLIGAGVAQLG
ncbi:hypothetical protein [Mycetocola miduiensis]|uniref:Uncharacterized protein n=1 Tax=Mycetocola miduiensis TaxID=995034 RepID=A0A1I4YEU4_9MICO|nr:hypothetical protein [Mycetocola miduiensis]SFN36555.1 hypothetical protein SAMN05216219_0180 [Mycetocola miduiensis]